MKENSIEKDEINAGLKILDDFANLYGNTVGMTENEYKKIQFAIDDILSDYKRVLEEKEEWQKAYQEEKDKQFELIRKNQELEKRWDNDTHKLQNDLDIANAKIVRLLNENKEVKDLIAYKNEYTKKLEKDLFENCNNYVITVQKVKDKIEELRNNHLRINENNRYYYETDKYNKIIIQVLQELIEERGK